MSTGLERIAEAFAAARADGRSAALMPYMMGGYPTLEESHEVGRALVEGGADLIELGVPFSDPLADGPVNHAAATAALRAGVTLEDVLALGASLAESVAVVVMCYLNPIARRGVERFADMLVAAGVSGLIVPDLPLEESGEVAAACAARELGWVPLVAPTTPDERMAAIGAGARGFLYVVGVTGTTGERPDGSGDGAGRAALLARARAACSCPVAFGFGISSAAQAAGASADGADGVIVGSRVVRAAGEGAQAVGVLTASLAAALAQGADGG